MVKIRDRMWTHMLTLIGRLERNPNYADASALATLARHVIISQPLRAKHSGAGGIIVTDIATGKPVPVNITEMPVDDLHLGDD